MSISLTWIDYLTLAGYFLLVFGIAWFVTVRERRKKGEKYNSGDYFLGGKNLGWFVIGASLFASNIGSEHLVGLSGAGARGDMPAAQFELLASLILIILAWVFVPFYIKSGVFTMPEFLERRYSKGARTYLSVVSILAYVLTKISITIFAGALVFEVLGVPFWTGAIVVVLATGVYTVLGGLRAVIYTDMLQMFILIIGSIAVTYFGIKAIGGWDEMMDTLQATRKTTAEGISYLNLWRPYTDSQYPWTGILFGAPILGIWYWCTDQFIVQRVLSARNIEQAQRGALFAGFLKLLPLFIFIIPGVIAFALHQQGMLSSMNDADKALPALISQILPNGLKGLILAGLLAALMSSLSSVFNSSSTLFTIDFYQRLKPNTSQKQLIFVGQIATVVLVILSLIWIPFMRSMMEDGGVYKYLQSIQAYISPPIAAVFLLGLFVKRLNGRGALLALWTGFGLGLLRLIGEYLNNENIIDFSSISFFRSFVEMNFLHFALVLFIISSVLLYTGSLMAKPLSMERLKNLVYEREEHTVKWWLKFEFWLTIALIIAVLFIWGMFSTLGLAA